MPRKKIYLDDSADMAQEIANAKDEQMRRWEIYFNPARFPRDSRAVARPFCEAAKLIADADPHDEDGWDAIHDALNKCLVVSASAVDREQREIADTCIEACLDSFYDCRDVKYTLTWLVRAMDAAIRGALPDPPSKEKKE